MQEVREYEKTWDLDVIFPGGSESKEFQSYLKTVEDEMKELTTIVQAFNPESQGIADELANIVAKLEKR